MAELTIKVGNTEIMFEGTPEELAVLAEKFGAGKTGEIEGPVRVGDTIEITKSETQLYTEGTRYEVVGTIDHRGGKRPKVVNDRGEATSVDMSKYRIVARKEDAPQPAKPSVKVGDYIVFDEGNPYITAGKAYEVTMVSSAGKPAVTDDEDESNYDMLPEEYRIITDARELAFAKAGRKLDEFKTGDIVRFNTDTCAKGYGKGAIAEVDGVISTGFRFGIDFRASPRWAELIAPAEARVDGE